MPTLDELNQAVQEAETLTIEQWRASTRTWGLTQKELTKVLRKRNPAFRASKAKKALNAMGGTQGEWTYLMLSLSNEALDRVIASFS